jgi:hypothetical protein
MAEKESKYLADSADSNQMLKDIIEKRKNGKKELVKVRWSNAGRNREGGWVITIKRNLK